MRIKDKTNSGHRQRLRKKFLTSGINSLHDYEIIELLLTFAVPVKDVKPQAKSLIKKFSSVSGVLDAEPRELTAVNGIGTSSASLIKLTRELMNRYSEEKMVESDFLNTPERVYEFSKLRIGSEPEEKFLAIFLTSKNRVISFEIISEGTVDSVAVYPRKVIETALKYKCSGVILVHNHPSGDVNPSKIDIELTDELKKISAGLDIRLLDHVIVSKHSYFSFSKQGLLT